jgi:hypothetical protein
MVLRNTQSGCSIRSEHGQIDGLIIENFVELSHEFWMDPKESMLPSCFAQSACLI